MEYHLVHTVGYAMAECHQAQVVATTKGRVASLARVAPIHEAIIVPHALMQNQVHHEAATLVQPTLVKEEELCLSD